MLEVLDYAGEVPSHQISLIKLNGQAFEDIWPSVCERLDSLANLPDGWDSYGAPSPKTGCLLAARIILKILLSENPTVAPPWIVPTGNGGIQLEWHKSGIDLEIEIDPEFGKSNIYVFDKELPLTARVVDFVSQEVMSRLA